MNILVVDDNASLAKGLCAFLADDGHEAIAAGSIREARQALDRRRFDLVITDLRLPDGQGLEIIKQVRAGDPPAEVLLMTAFGSVDTAVEAMRLGAMDYLTKPVPPEELSFRVRRVEESRRLTGRLDTLQRAHQNLLETTGQPRALADLVGSSPVMGEVKTLIRKAASFPSTVLLTGETGTGKEVAARAIHHLSPRAEGPFVRVNCASIPDSLFESELFGHEKGAFTDAHERRLGRFETAQGGTLFLDEVGEVPMSMQAKLLRVLQEKEIVRVGGNRPITVDARIVAATNRDLEQMAARGDFREDLLYRLAVIRIPLPALRARCGDIPELVEHVLGKLREEFGRPDLQLLPAALDGLCRLEWRGNVRQLRNALERAVVLAEGDTLGPALFTSETRGAEPTAQERGNGFPGGAIEKMNPAESSDGSNGHSLPEGGLTAALATLERHLIESALARHQGNRSKAALELRISRPNLVFRLKKLGVIPPEPSPQ
jgi:DNA-binding NtrC family response regulator